MARETNLDHHLLAQLCWLVWFYSDTPISDNQLDKQLVNCARHM